MTGPEMADLLVKRVGRIVRFARNHKAPFIANITKTELRMYLDGKSLMRAVELAENGLEPG